MLNHPPISSASGGGSRFSDERPRTGVSRFSEEQQRAGVSRFSEEQQRSFPANPAARAAMSPPPRISSSLAHTALPPPPRSSSFRYQLDTNSGGSRSFHTVAADPKRKRRKSCKSSRPSLARHHCHSQRGVALGSRIALLSTSTMMQTFHRRCVVRQPRRGTVVLRQHTGAAQRDGRP